MADRRCDQDNIVGQLKSGINALHATARASYTSHYRRACSRLVDVLEFGSSNSTHRPVIAALDLVARYARGMQYYPDGEDVPAHRVIGGDWADLVVKVDQRGRRRVV